MGPGSVRTILSGVRLFLFRYFFRLVKPDKGKDPASVTTIRSRYGRRTPGRGVVQAPVRQQGTDTVEEYRKHGKLYFVRVLSNNGPTRYYIDNPANVPLDMRKLSGPSGVVEPVYYKLFEWK